MQGEIVGENSLKCGEKEYFCSSINLKEFGANIGDIVEFTPKGSIAVVTKILEKHSVYSQNSRINELKEKLNQNYEKQEKRQEFKNKKIDENFDDDDDLWHGFDTEKSTNEYLKNRTENKNKAKLFRIIFYFLFIYILLSFITGFFGSIRIIKSFG